jgi:2-iminobutanoate/2-iminopropanoate deaminase
MSDRPSLRPPYGRYRHVAAVDGARRLVAFSGQIAVRADDTVPEGIGAQTRLILDNYDLLLADVGLERRHVLRLTTYLVDPADRAGYMAVRDAWVPDPPPASTLVYVSGLVSPALRVEIEALAAG